MEEDLRGLAFKVQRIVLFCPHQGRVWVTQAKVMSALEKEKDTRGSPTQKQGLGSAVLGIGETSENGANCGEYKALAMQGASIRCQGLCVCVCVCIPSLICLLCLPSFSRDSCGSRPVNWLPNKPDLAIFLQTNNHVWSNSWWMVAGEKRLNGFGFRGPEVV